MNNRAHLLATMKAAVNTLRSLNMQWSARQKRAIWKQHVDINERWVPIFQAAAVKVLEEQKREVLAIVNRAKSKSIEAKATIAWQWLNESISEFLLGAADDQWRSVFVPIVQGLVTEQAEAWAVTMGLQFSVQNLFAAEWFDNYTLTFAQPINRTTLDGLANVMAQAQLEGWSIPTLQNHISDMFQQWMVGDMTSQDFEWYAERLPPWRAELIARTEITHSSNAGTAALHKSWGVRRHEWLATFDGRERETHGAASGQVVPIDQPFIVGGFEMMYPGDSSRGAPLSEICNCRCTTLPVLSEFGIWRG